MKNLTFYSLLLFTGLISTYNVSYAENIYIPPVAQPIFLKLGFSSVIEFDEEPEKVIVGDRQNFQVEKTNKSLVIRSLNPYASSNLFVYFKKHATQIYSLTADEEALPTLLKKVTLNNLVENKKTDVIKNELSEKIVKKYSTHLKLRKTEYTKAKDYLTIDYWVITGSDSKLSPVWKKIRLKCGKTEIPPYKTWAEREEIQKDSEIKARVIFLRPNVGQSLSLCTLILPLKNKETPLKLEVK